MSETIQQKLAFFHEQGKIPHIIFHGPQVIEIKRIVSHFVHTIYDGNRLKIKQNVMCVPCSGKGIKFIRDEIKTFAKMHIQAGTNIGGEVPVFKTILLVNADYLTEDAQSALRRSIELFSHNTRFFMIAENKHKLLKPILSRFCEIYVAAEPGFPSPAPPNWFVLRMNAFLTSPPTTQELYAFTTDMYENGLSCQTLLDYLARSKMPQAEKVVNTRFLYHKLKYEYRNEKMLILTLLDFLLFRSFDTIKSICI